MNYGDALELALAFRAIQHNIKRLASLVQASSVLQVRIGGTVFAYKKCRITTD